MSYALYKFHKAIISLYGADLQKRQWLTSSYIHHIIHLRRHDLPEALREQFEQLRAMLMRVSCGSDLETLEQTVKTMDNAAVNGAIDRIVALYDAIRQYEDAAEEEEA